MTASCTSFLVFDLNLVMLLEGADEAGPDDAPFASDKAAAAMVISTSFVSVLLHVHELAAVLLGFSQSVLDVVAEAMEGTNAALVLGH